MCLIIFRGYPYTHTNTGMYLYLFYQNLTNLFFLSMLFLNIFNTTFDVKIKLLELQEKKDDNTKFPLETNKNEEAKPDEQEKLLEKELEEDNPEENDSKVNEYRDLF